MTPEEKARENIDTLLVQAGWKIQNVKDVDFDYVPFSQQGGLGRVHQLFGKTKQSVSLHIRTILLLITYCYLLLYNIGSIPK
jgi:hypothetical protein